MKRILLTCVLMMTVATIFAQFRHEVEKLDSLKQTIVSTILDCETSSKSVTTRHIIDVSGDYPEMELMSNDAYMHYGWVNEGMRYGLYMSNTDNFCRLYVSVLYDGLDISDDKIREFKSAQLQFIFSLVEILRLDIPD